MIELLMACYSPQKGASAVCLLQHGGLFIVHLLQLSLHISCTPVPNLQGSSRQAAQASVAASEGIITIDRWQPGWDISGRSRLLPGDSCPTFDALSNGDASAAGAVSAAAAGVHAGSRTAIDCHSSSSSSSSSSQVTAAGVGSCPPGLTASNGPDTETGKRTEGIP